jgi:hypothetical protein
MPDATERKALILCTFVSGCIALAPLEWVSGFALVLLSGLFTIAHQAISRREGAFLALLDAWEPLAVEGPSVALGAGEAERIASRVSASGVEEASGPAASRSEQEAEGEAEPKAEREAEGEAASEAHDEARAASRSV